MQQRQQRPHPGRESNPLNYFSDAPHTPPPPRVFPAFNSRENTRRSNLRPSCPAKHPPIPSHTPTRAHIPRGMREYFRYARIFAIFQARSDRGKSVGGASIRRTTSTKPHVRSRTFALCTCPSSRRQRARARTSSGNYTLEISREILSGSFASLTPSAGGLFRRLQYCFTSLLNKIHSRAYGRAQRHGARRRCALHN